MMGKHYFWTCLWRYIQMRPALNRYTEQSRWSFSGWVGINQSAEDLKRTKKWRIVEFPLSLSG